MNIYIFLGITDEFSSIFYYNMDFLVGSLFIKTIIKLVKKTSSSQMYCNVFNCLRGLSVMFD